MRWELDFPETLSLGRVAIQTVIHAADYEVLARSFEANYLRSNLYGRAWRLIAPLIVIYKFIRRNTILTTAGKTKPFEYVYETIAASHNYAIFDVVEARHI